MGRGFCGIQETHVFGPAVEVNRKPSGIGTACYCPLPPRSGEGRSQFVNLWPESICHSPAFSSDVAAEAQSLLIWTGTQATTDNPKVVPKQTVPKDQNLAAGPSGTHGF